VVLRSRYRKIWNQGWFGEYPRDVSIRRLDNGLYLKESEECRSKFKFEKSGLETVISA